MAGTAVEQRLCPHGEHEWHDYATPECLGSQLNKQEMEEWLDVEAELILALRNWLPPKVGWPEWV